MIPIEELYQLLTDYDKLRKSKDCPRQSFNLNEKYSLNFYSVLDIDISSFLTGREILNIEDLRQFYHLFTEKVILRLEEGLIKLL